MSAVNRKNGNPIEVGVEEITFYYEEMVRSHLLELEIVTPAGKLTLKRIGGEFRSGHPLRRRTDFLGPAPLGHLDPLAPSAGPAAAASEPAAPPKTIVSPLMGVFYRASSPQSPPLVKEGDAVEPNTTLCIVEAMKVMNEIKSGERCRIVRILVENGKPVTKDQPLFHVEPA